MTEYIDQIKEDFPIELKKETKAWSHKLFSVENGFAIFHGLTQ